MLAIDIHTHLLPEKFPDFAKKFGEPKFISLKATKPGCADMVQDGKVFRSVDERLWNPRVRLNDCDRHDVGVQVLSTVPVMFSYWAKPQQALEVSRFLNDHMAEFVSQNRKRFLGLGSVPLQDMTLAVNELERCSKELRLSGVEIGTHVNGENLDAPALFPFYEAAEKLNMPIFVHAWDMLAKERMKKFWLPWLIGMPTETAIAIASLVFGGVFDRFPKLRFAFSHGGGAFPFLLGRISHGFTTRPDLCAVHTQTNPMEYARRFWVDSAVHDPNALAFLIDKMGTERIALGSDYPFPLGEDTPGTLIRSLPGLNEVQRKNLLSGSALSWLGKTETEFQT